MEERLVNGLMIIQRDFDELKTELEKIRSQISELQKKHLGKKDMIAFARFRISNLEITLKDIQAGHQMAPKRTSTSAASAMTQAAIRQLIADSVAVALEAQAATMENTNHTNKNTGPSETPVARKGTNDHKRKFNDRRNTTKNDNNNNNPNNRDKNNYLNNHDNNNYPNDRNNNNHCNNRNNNKYQDNCNNNYRNNDYHQQQNRRQETVKTYAATLTKNKRDAPFTIKLTPSNLISIHQWSPKADQEKQVKSQEQKQSKEIKKRSHEDHIL
nr:hypothetical protein [Tanacetum cinerariifolium]